MTRDRELRRTRQEDRALRAKVVELLARQPDVTVAVVQEHLGIARTTAGRWLKEAREKR